MNDPYRVLGVGRDADASAIKSAFRKLAKTWHPDKNPGDASSERRFKEVNAAYDILGDADKRRRFDAGEIDSEGREQAPFGFGARSSAGAGFSGFGRRQSAGGSFSDPDMESVLNDLFGNRFRGFGGFAGAGAEASAQGGDVRAKLTLDFLDAARGGRQRVTLPTGRTVEVNIPAGAEDGQTLRLKGQGDGGGDMLIELAVRPHPRFRREGLDLHLDHPVPLAVAIAGGRVNVPTLQGDVRAKVAPRTDGGTTLRLRGKGIKKADGTAGDLLVHLNIAVPKTREPELERWADAQMQRETDPA